MTKVMIVGDTHGDDQFVANLHKQARALEVKKIIQLGDFGYNFDRNLLGSIEAWLKRDEEHEWFWLDGNHDQHDYIEEVILSDEHTWDAPVEHFNERMYYCPRGSTTRIGDKQCMFLGGAYSIDKYRRKAHVSWWPQEMIRYADVDRAIRNGAGVDIMFTHDTPPTVWIEQELRDSGYKADENSRRNRQMVGYAVDAVRPQELWHGHYHWRYETTYETPEGWQVDVNGVGANINRHHMMDPTAIFDHNFVIREF